MREGNGDDGAGEEMPCCGTEGSGGRIVAETSCMAGAPSGMVWYRILPLAVSRLRACSPISKGEDGRESDNGGGGGGDVTGAEYGRFGMNGWWIARAVGAVTLTE